MSDVLLHAFLGAALLAGAAVAAWVERRTIARNSVSTLTQSDYAPGLLQHRLGWAALASALLFLLLLVVIGGAPPITGFAVAALFGTFRATLVVQTIAGARATTKTRLIEALQDPEIGNARFAFFFSGVDHFLIWKDYIQSSGETPLLVLRDKKLFYQMKKRGYTPAILVENKEMRDVFSAVAQNITAVFYANNSIHNINIVKLLGDATHVQLLHGDSDKPPSYNPVTKGYDRIFVAGQMAIDRYALNGVDISPERFRIVGRPQVAAIRPAEVKAPGAPLQVGYMPTWRGYFEDSQLSSLNRAARIIETVHKVLPDARITFKPHPLSFKDPLWPQFKREIRTALSGSDAFAPKGAKPFDLYNQSDILITDISSVMIDFLYSGKPFLVIQPEKFDAAETWRFPSLAASYQVGPGLDNLAEKLTLATGCDRMKTQREEMLGAVFGDLDRPPGEAFRAACLEILNEAPVPQATDKDVING